MKTLVITPTYDEALNIERLLEQFGNVVPNVDVLVVDDNSPDGTAGIVKRVMESKPYVRLLCRPKKQGLAAAYLAGFEWGLARGYERLVQMDADFSHGLDDLERLLKVENADAVFGSRYCGGGKIEGWSRSRSWISRGGCVYAKWILNSKIKDLTGGFSAWSSSTLGGIDFESIKSRGYAFQIEMKYRAERVGFSIKEVPITFRERARGRSKMTARIAIEAALLVLWMRFSRLPSGRNKSERKAA